MRRRGSCSAVVVVLGVTAVASHAGAATPSGEAGGTRQARPIDLAEVQRLATSQGFPSLRARAEAEIGRTQDSEALGRLLPSLSGQLGLVEVDGATQSSSTGEFDRATYGTASPYVRVGYGANFAEAIFGKVAAGRRVRALEAGVSVAERTLRELAADQYFDLVQSRANMRVAELAVVDARDLLRIATVLEQQGLGRGDDVTRAKSELAAAEQNRLRAERAFHRASITLAGTLALDTTVLLVPAEADAKVRDIAGTDAGPAALIEQALRDRPEVMAIDLRLSAAEAGHAAAWATVAGPRIELFYQQGGLGPDYAALEPRRLYGGMLTWTLSAEAIAAISTAGARVEAAVVDTAETRQGVATEVANAEDDVRLVKARLEPAAAGLKSAEDTLRISNVRFQNGNAILIEVIQAQKSVELARLNHVAATVDYNRAQVRLLLAVGPSLQGDSHAQHE